MFNMNYNELKKQWIAEEQHAFKGWDFSHIDGRWESEQLPWDYKEVVQQHLKDDDELLDMGTGGGEFLLTLNHPYHNTSVTEAYEPNVKLCKEKLVPLGITVMQVFDDNMLPYDSESFDIIINRHEEYDEKEVNRLLKDGKMFITQQVGGQNNVDLSNRLLGEHIREYSEHTLKNNIRVLENAGFEVVKADEVIVPIKFFDVGAFVYFAKIIEWEFPSFSVEKHFDKLCEFRSEIEQTGCLTGHEHRFIIAAKKK